MESPPETFSSLRPWDHWHCGHHAHHSFPKGAQDEGVRVKGLAATEAGRDDWEQEHCRAAYTAAGGTGQTSRLATLQPLNSTFSPFTSNPNSLLTNKKQLPHSSCVQTFPHSLQWRPRLQNKNAQKIFFGDSRCFLNNALIQSFQNGSGGRSAVLPDGAFPSMAAPNLSLGQKPGPGSLPTVFQWKQKNSILKSLHEMAFLGFCSRC